MKNIRNTAGSREVNVLDEPFLAAPGIAIKVDKAVVAGSFAALSGWVSSSLNLAVRETRKYVTFNRQDVNRSIYLGVKGFLLFAHVEPGQRTLKINIKFGDVNFDATVPLAAESAELGAFIAEHTQRLPYVTGELIHVKEWAKLLYPTIQTLVSDRVIGNIDHCRGAANQGVAVYGWCLAKQNVNVFLLTENGTLRPLAEAIRFPRPDVMRTFRGDYGAFADQGGLFASLDGALAQGGRVAIVAESGGVFFKVAEKAVEKVSASAQGYAKWAFALQIPQNRFIQRMTAHDGKYLINMMEAAELPNADLPIESWSIGPRPSTPVASLIVPLYGRADYVEHQLLAFRDDPDFKDSFAELIYVIDDPALVDQIKDAAGYYELMYGVPVTFVTAARNLGYAQANNLGAAHARGDYLIFLNSDVFPEETAWISRMVNTIVEQPGIGVLGARLLYPQGAIQHVGMHFEYAREMEVWLNEHDYLGMPVPGDLPRLRKVPAVTGACMAVRRTYFDQVSGFSRDYLIGDFEDSDLCLKIARLGAEVACLTDTRLIHLERQSVRLSDQDADFRQKIVYFNAWQHSRKWSETISLYSGN